MADLPFCRSSVTRGSCHERRGISFLESFLSKRSYKNELEYPCDNNARFDYLMFLARNLENNVYGYNQSKRFKALKLAAIYRDMAFEAMPSAAAASELNLTDRARLAAKLRLMTVENGCTEGEADNAAQLLLKLEGGK